MLNHILVPLDESELSERALAPARNILAKGGKITLMTVVVPYNSTQYDWAENHEIEKGMREHTDAYLERICQELRRENIFAKTYLDIGDPATKIIDAAHKLKVDAVVISTHGRSGVKRWMFGSVTQKILGALMCPVMVIPNR